MFMKKIYIVIVAGIIIISMQIYLMSSKRNEYSKAIQNLEMIKDLLLLNYVSIKKMFYT